MRGQGPSAGHLARFSRPRAAPLAVGGRFQFSLRDQGCALRPEGQPEKGRCRGHRAGRTFRPAARDSSCLSLNGSGPSAPTAPPLHSGRAHCALTPCSRSSTSLSPRAVGFAGVLCGWAPGCGTLAQTSSCLQDRKHSHTDTCPVYTARIRTLHGRSFPVPAALHSPHCCHLSPACAERREEDSSQTWAGRAAGRGGTLFPNLVPGAPNKRTTRPPDMHSLALVDSTSTGSPGQARPETCTRRRAEEIEKQGDTRRETVTERARRKKRRAKEKKRWQGWGMSCRGASSPETQPPATSPCLVWRGLTTDGWLNSEKHK